MKKYFIRFDFCCPDFFLLKRSDPDPEASRLVTIKDDVLYLGAALQVDAASEGGGEAAAAVAPPLACAALRLAAADVPRLTRT